MQVLVMCTANICRSPMAERMLRRHVAARDADATIISAGLLEGGRAASDGSVRVLANLGLDLSDHLSTRIDADAVTASDLVLAMEVRHVREAVLLAPDRLDHIYTLRELVERAQEIGPRGPQPLDTWLADLSQGRTPGSLVGRTDLDVADPYGGPAAGYDRAGAELHALTSEAADLLWGPVPDDTTVFSAPAIAPAEAADGRNRVARWFTRR